MQFTVYLVLKGCFRFTGQPWGLLPDIGGAVHTWLLPVHRITSGVGVLVKILFDIFVFFGRFKVFFYLEVGVRIGSGS